MALMRWHVTQSACGHVCKTASRLHEWSNIDKKFLSGQCACSGKRPEGSKKIVYISMNPQGLCYGEHRGRLQT